MKTDSKILLPELNPALKMPLMRVLSSAVSRLQVFGLLPAQKLLKINGLCRHLKALAGEIFHGSQSGCGGVFAPLNFRIDARKFLSIRKYFFVYTKIYFRLYENLSASKRKFTRVHTKLQGSELRF